METSEPVPPKPTCKNHPNTASGYFVVEQPWIKYCRNCALNVALCGRKIEKELNSQQFDRKMQISAVVTELKRSIEEVDQNSQFYSKLTSILEQAAVPLSERIRSIEQALKELTESKEKLQKLYEEEIAGKITAYFEKQSRIGMQADEMKQELEHIESNFGTLIETEDTKQFQEKNSRWNALLSSHRRELIDQQQFTDIKCKISEVMESFYDQFQVISRFSLQSKHSPDHIRNFDQTFDMVLTPVDSNSLSESSMVDNIKINCKAKGQLKLRSTQRNATDRDYGSFKKNGGKRPSFYGVENCSEWPESGRKKVY